MFPVFKISELEYLKCILCCLINLSSVQSKIIVVL